MYAYTSYFYAVLTTESYIYLKFSTFFNKCTTTVQIRFFFKLVGFPGPLGQFSKLSGPQKKTEAGSTLK